MRSIILVCLLVAVVPAFSQYKHSAADAPYGTFGIGVGFQDFEAINNRIENYPQYKQLRDVTGLLQLGWIKEKRRVISIFNVMAGSTMSGDRDKRSSVVKFIGVQGDIGYDVIKNDRVMLYPYAGIGYEWYKARFFRDVSSVEFDDVLENVNTRDAIKSTDLKNAFFLYQVGLGFAVKNPRNPNKLIGIQAAYSGSFEDRTWRSNENQVLTGSPEDDLGRFHISLILGAKPQMMHTGK